MRTANSLTALASALLAASTMTACSTPGTAGDAATAQPAASAEPHAPMTARRMFAAADVDKDGKLTCEEARGRLPLTYSSFDQIDVSRRGWISFDQFMAFTQARTGKTADDILHMGDRM